LTCSHIGASGGLLIVCILGSFLSSFLVLNLFLVLANEAFWALITLSGVDFVINLVDLLINSKDLWLLSNHNGSFGLIFLVLNFLGGILS
jgi:hypothetical protein